MNRNEITDLWMQSDRQLRSMAAHMAVALLPDSWSTCIDMLCSCEDEGPARELTGLLLAQMPFLKMGYAPCHTISEGPFLTFDSYHQSYQALITLLSKERDAHVLRRCYHHFEGIRGDIRHLHPELDFCSDAAANMSEDSHRQLMVFVTGRCNLKCSYCFSNDMEQLFISTTDLKRIFTWAGQNGCNMVTPCGGEPLIYPHIDTFFDLVREHGMHTYFASNCTIPLTRFSKQQLECIDLITFHMTEHLWHAPEHMRIFCENIETARQHHIDIIARGNIVTPDQDITSWLDIIDRYQIKRMNIALTIPSGSHNNKYIDTRLFSDFREIIMRCVNACRDRQINLSFAKPIPPCVFDEETARWLLQFNNFMPLCNVHEDDCTRNICLSPDLLFTPCLGVHQPQVAFSEQLTWEQLQQDLGNEVNRALRKPLFERCEHCFLYNRHLCQGACLSYKYLTSE